MQRIFCSLFVLASIACGPVKDAEPSESGTSGDLATSSGTGDADAEASDDGTDPPPAGDTGDAIELGPCSRVAECIDATDEAITPFLAVYGPEGTCWDDFESDQCWQDCRALLDTYEVQCATIAACCECVVLDDCAYDPSYAACTDGHCVAEGSETDGGTIPSHAADVYPIIETYCVAECHEPAGLWPTLDQSGGAAAHYSTVVGTPSPTQAPTVNLVEPGDPANSYLWAKLTNTHIALGGAGVQMPHMRPSEAAPAMLDPAELAIIEAWILAGAPE